MRLQNHRLGNYNDDQQSLFPFKMPFCSTEPNGHVNVEFDVAREGIDEGLPFLPVLPSIIAAGASFN